MRKIPETVAEMFGHVEELLLGGGSVDNTVGSDAHAGPLCELEKELCEMCIGAEES